MAIDLPSEEGPMEKRFGALQEVKNYKKLPLENSCQIIHELLKRKLCMLWCIDRFKACIDCRALCIRFRQEGMGQRASP